MDAVRILVVEDNPETSKNIRLYLQHHGYQCQCTSSGSAGLALALEGDFNLVILDVMLPDLNGYEVCRRIKAVLNLPVIMLTARTEDMDLVNGFNCGADDYLKKPYSNKELMARVANLLRRHQVRNPTTAGPFRWDEQACQAWVNKVALPLTKTEFQILHTFLKSPGRVYSRDHLFQQCFDQASESSDRTVDVHVHNLRKKIVKAGLEKHGISSVYGLGYKWMLP